MLKRFDNHATLLFAWLMLPVLTFSTQFRYEHLNVNDGLSNHVVWDIIQDSQGFIWISSEGGLDRFDGYTFKNFNHDPAKPDGLRSNHVSRILESHYNGDSYLWLDTIDGLFRFNLHTEEIESFLHNPNDSTSIIWDNVRAIVNGKIGSIWIGTRRGLDRFDYSTGEFHHVIPDLAINELYFDDEGILWIGTFSQGLIRYDPVTSDRIEYLHNSEDPSTIAGNFISRGMFDSEYFGSNFLWVSTGDRGFNLLDKSKGIFQSFNPQPTPPYYNSQATFETTHAGRTELWVKTHPAGFRVLDLDSKTFTHHDYSRDYPDGLSSHLVHWMFKDSSETIWVGSYMGIDVLSRHKQQFSRIIRTPERDLTSNVISSLLIDSQDILWIGTATGLNRLDLNTGTLLNFDLNTNIPETLRKRVIGAIREDRHGNLWFITNNGVYRSSPDMDKVTRYLPDRNDEHSLVHRFNNGMELDSQGNVWIGSYEGLEKYDAAIDGFHHYLKGVETSGICFPTSDDTTTVLVITRNGLVEMDTESGEYHVYRTNPLDTSGLSNDRGHDLFQDSQGTIWIPTNDGLNYTDPKHRIRGRLQFKHFSTEDGLPTNTVVSVEEDDNGTLWFATTGGLSRFDRASRTFRNYNDGDGLSPYPYYQRAHTKDNDGRLYFGSLGGGITVFHPDSLFENPFVPPIQITDFQLFHRSVQVAQGGEPASDGEFRLPNSIAYLDTLILNYRQNVFSLHFAALDYRNPASNRYAYRLIGFEDNWVYTDADNRSASYTNLNPGKYHFEVKGTNNDGLWNETGASLVIIITPPWWQTAVAYVIYVLVAFASIISLLLLRSKQLKDKHLLEIEHLRAERFQELDELKTRFFSNISHEFRTPLTLILGPLETLKGKIRDAASRKSIDMILGQAKSILNLVNELLDLSKLDSGQLKLKVSEQDPTQLIRTLVYSFSSTAEQRNIKVEFQDNSKKDLLFFDHDALVKIINNLMSNAIKYTADGGRVMVELSDTVKSDLRAEDELKIEVRDSGIGISSEHMDKIFDRFYQAESGYTRKYEGTGVGLALARELVLLHSGSIEVENNDDVGTTFIVRLPKGSGHFNSDEIVPYTVSTTETHASAEVSVRSDKTMHTEFACTLKPLVLIVDDNADIRAFIRTPLERDYRCHEALDGKEGLAFAQSELPDLIISDIMMPEMDGVELCAHIKKDERTNHIPVILLTAKADIESKLEGLGIGADDYLTKPFESEELQIRIKNLIEQRRMLREHFQRDLKIIPDDHSLSSSDDEFIQKAIEVVSANIESTDFGVEQFSKQIFLSRQHLTRKLQSLTGLSALEFIRSIRLKRAAILLKQKQASVTEIAYQVGFSQPSNFATAFKNEFGVNPSDFQ